MKGNPNRSLAGKARRNHRRNRASRLYARQWIDETLDTEPEDQTAERYIPIRGRREFLPTAAATGTSTMNARDDQLELPLSATSPDKHAKRPAAELEPAPGISTESDKVISFPTRATSPAGMPFKPPVQFHRRSQFTFRGFLVGCAMGSVAAVVLLAVVRVVAG
ncbi:MAG: hypothetical protein PVI86_14085 [Phycisphaerae bacterium]|jgi:hypothetical protein